MVLEVLVHAKCPNLFLSENLGHLGVRGEVLLVLWGLQVFLPDVGPEALDHLNPAKFLSLGHAQEVNKGLREAERFGESTSFRHCRKGGSKFGYLFLLMK